jgi:hypothetical protein
MKSTMTRVALTLVLGFVVTVHSANAQAASAEEIMERSLRAFHYAGNDAKGKLTMELIDRNGGKRVRVLTMLRRNQEAGGDQKYFMYFHEPGDVRRLTFMVWKYPTREDDRWIFIPAVDLIRRIAAEDKYSSFVGSDFTHEDVSGRDVAEDSHTLLREEKLGDREVFVIESVPREAAAFTKRVSWIDKENFLPLKEEYYDAQNELQRVFTADRIEEIVYPTIMKRTMRNVQTGHRTEVTVNSVAYDLGLKDADFSERRMRRPPRSWIR